MRPMAATPKSAIAVQANLFCKNSCGYYGNSNWHGYCSVCYRDLKAKKAEERAKPLTQALQAGLVPSFNSFETKRRQVADRGANTLRNLLKKPPEPRAKSPSPSSSTSTEEAAAAAAEPGAGVFGPDDGRFRQEFRAFVGSLGKSAALDLTRQLRLAVGRLKDGAKDGGADELAEAVQDFYASLQQRLRQEPAYRRTTDEQRQAAVDWAETCVTRRLYEIAFSHGPGEEARDMEMQQRIRSLHWITPAMLDSRIQPNNAEFDAAVACLISMDSFLTPPEKLDTIVQCARHIFKALNSCSSGAASADDFLPALIFVVLTANPPRLQSNVAFVSRFANSSRLNSGEQGYFFTNLCCAVSFVEKMNHESLNLPKDLFDKFMSGQLSPETHGLSAQERVRKCQRLFDERREELDKLEADVAAFNQQVDAEEAKFREFADELRRKVEEHRRLRPLRLLDKERIQRVQQQLIQ